MDLAKKNRIDEIEPQAVIQYYSTLRRIAKDYMASVPDLSHLPGIWIHGHSGCGKSRLARARYSGAYLKNCNKWWDGYQGEADVIIDDWDPKHSVLGYHLKIWADRYAFTAEVKGGAIRIRPTWIVVTSQYHPMMCFDGETFSAIKRRFIIFKLD